MPDLPTALSQVRHMAHGSAATLLTSERAALQAVLAERDRLAATVAIILGRAEYCATRENGSAIDGAQCSDCRALLQAGAEERAEESREAHDAD
jgi:hypothetical protein